MPSNHNEIEKKLWDAADELRANSKLKSSEYSVAVRGLISLRYADHKFSQLEKDRLKRALDAGSMIDSGTVKDDDLTGTHAMTSPEDKARENIDQMLAKAGWVVRDQGDSNNSAYRGIALRNFTLKREHGFADYLLYVDGRAAGVVEAKREGDTLTGVEIQSDKYTKGLLDGLPGWSKPLPFSYESTGVESRFTT